MPPRVAPGQGAPHRGAGRPPRGGRGGGAGRGGTHVGAQAPVVAEHIRTIGVKRPGFGTAGRAMNINVNMFPVSIPDEMIRHYDVAIEPSNLPTRFNLQLIKRLQCEIAPEIFTPKVVYDGRKNIFATRDLDLGPTNARTFDVTLNGNTGGRPPKIYRIKVTKVAEVNPELLHRFIAGNQSIDNQVLTALTALNVVIRMDPNERYPFNVRSFFTDQETKAIGGGIVLWRGYFQSVRPAIGKMLINVDISTGMMYRPGQLIDLCLEFFGRTDPAVLSPDRGLPDSQRLKLQKFLLGLRIVTNHTRNSGTPKTHVIRRLSSQGANRHRFEMRDGRSMTVADYFAQEYNRRLRYPAILCVEVGNGAMLPMELCQVPPGQIMRRQPPPEKVKDVLEFSTKKPHERLQSIRNGIGILQYGQSDYIRQFGMHVETASGPLSVQARILQAPNLRYGPGSKQPNITPRDGSWNMMDKRFMKPMDVPRWVVVIYETERRFPLATAREMVGGIIAGCRSVGMRVQDEQPIIKYENGQGRIGDQLRNAGMECVRARGGPPSLIVVVLPDGGNDIYTAVKHFGDVTQGVATQCLKSNKCSRAKMQYWANVCLKLNVKLGGINVIPDPASVAVLTDPREPTIVMGADVMHPAPGTTDRPSFTALVGNVDSDTAKYIATTNVQTSRQERIDDLQQMAKHILKSYIEYRAAVEKKPNSPPKRIIFYRDGVSEGQFQEILDQELPLIKAACDELKIKPKITLIVVGKRHHIRFFPMPNGPKDRSDNCPAGTVVDRDIVHPTEFDFYLQSHGGLLGTSRPAHYSVIYDENAFNADSLQALSFALCHVYARATRSVSIPAPVYYADIVCARAKNHYDPQGSLNLSETATDVTEGQADATLQAFRQNYRPLHPNQSRLMYFS